MARKLFLLDGMPLVYRGYFVFLKNPRRTSRGANVSPVYGYTNTLLQILEREQPTHIAVVFDTAVPTFRHQRYPEYKAQRDEIPEAIIDALPKVRALTEALRIPVITCDGYEADDIIGTLAIRARQAGFETYMVTPDKDFSQLVAENIYLYRPSRVGEGIEIEGLPEVLARWGIEHPQQVVEILGLQGDSVDNIPGVPGIGEKTAQKLIAQYGTVEGVLAHSAELKGKQRENLETYAEQARLSRWLATIKTDVPLEVDLESLARQEPDAERLRAILAELEFATLARRLLGDTGTVPGQGSLFEGSATLAPQPATRASGIKTIQDVPHTYTLVADETSRNALLHEIERQAMFCFDLETTSLNPMEAAIVGIAFSWAPHTACYVAFPPDRKHAQEVLEMFRPVLENPAIEKTGHNLKYDISVLHWHGVTVQGTLFDTMLAHYVLEPEVQRGMDALAANYLNYQPIPISALIGEKGKQQRSMADVPPHIVAEYAGEDADITLQLREIFLPLLRSRNAERIFYEVECPLIPVLVAMEAAGVTIDTGALAEYSRVLEKDCIELESRIYDLAGMHFNINSPRQLGEVLFERLKLGGSGQRTRTGQHATSEQVLSRLAGRHEIVRLVLDYRAACKLKSTYVDALPAAVSPRTGRVHSTFSQAVTATGRIASHNPNLQNIPIRTDRGREIRRAFVPRGPGRLLLSADYSQIELRIIAELSQDEAMLEAFAQGADIHRTTAARIYGVIPQDVTDEMRRKAKTVNFGIAYGMTAHGLAERLEIPRSEAAAIIDQYFRQYPGIKNYIDRTIQSAREKGYVETILGRRRYVPDIRSQNAAARNAAERNAINAPIQGTAADMIKLAMVRIHRELTARRMDVQMILQIHDELLFDLPESECPQAADLIEHAMKSALPFRVPIVVEIGTGANWLEAH